MSTHEAVWLKLELHSDWRVGASYADSPDIDLDAVVTAEGLPVLPGRTLRGLLRDAMRVASMAACSGSNPVTPELIDACFGTDLGAPEDAERREMELEARRLQTRAGGLRVDNAELGADADARAAIRAWARTSGKDAVPFLFKRVAATRIADDGVAEDHTLRASRVALPATLYARVEAQEGAESPLRGHDWKAALEQALPFLRELGSSRTRGFGRVTVTVARVEGEANACADTASSQNEATSGEALPSTPEAWLCVTLLDDLDRKYTGASGPEVGGALPGAMLLGAAAARLYGQLQAEGRAFEAFHSGGVRFGDALPAVTCGDGVLAQAWPMPKVLHGIKGAPDQPAWNLAIERPAEGQLVAVEGRWLLPDGRRPALAHDLSLRTAIGPHGSARGGMLYTIHALRRGQRFLTRVAAEDASLLREVVAALVSRPVHLGGSRGAELGRCQVEEVEGAEPWPSDPVKNTDAAIVIWCVADVCLADEAGQPRLLPQPGDIGLGDGWALDLSRSMLRHRRYSTFHGKRGRPSLDRQVIAAGSVWVFARGNDAAPANPSSIEAATRGGVGIYRAEGLGRVCVQPSILSSAQVALGAHVALPEPTTPPEANGAAREPAVAAAMARQRLAVRRRTWLFEATQAARKLRDRDLPAAQLGALRAFALERQGLDRGAFLEAFRGQFSAEGARAEAQIAAPAPRGEAGYAADNQRRVRDGERSRGGGGALQKRRWQARGADGTSAARVVIEAVERCLSSERDGALGDAARFTAMIASRAARARRSDEAAAGDRPVRPRQALGPAVEEGE